MFLKYFSRSLEIIKEKFKEKLYNIKLKLKINKNQF